MSQPLAVGANAPDFTLEGPAGPVSLGELITSGPAILAFFKQTCPTCKMAFPVYGEVAARFRAEIPVVAIAQDPLPEAVRWIAEFGFDGPVLDDAAGGYAVSDLYGVQSVPSVFVIGADGAIADMAEGWQRGWTNALVARLAGITGGNGSPVSTEGDGRPALKPG